jgi:serine/threonine-protein kinase
VATEHRGTLAPGYTLEEYRIESVLGRGGFGVTYLAYDAHLEKQVAIKEYLPSQFAVREADSTVVPRSTADADDFRRFLERFLREARTLAKLQHPNIVRVLRYFEGLGTAYMVMEYERGKSLGQTLQAMTAPPDVAWICGWLRPLLDGLAAVHAAEFLHRDIKPPNIFIRLDGTPLLLDFGAARSVAADAGGLTAIYTAGYAPLEQYSSEGNQGAWTDIYGMAAVLYRVVTGNAPIDAPQRSQRDTLVAAIQCAGTRYDPRLLAPIDWGLRLDERARPQSVAEWRAGRDGVAGLDAILCPDEPTAVQPPTRPSVHERTTVVAPAAPKVRSSRTRIAVAAGATVIVALAAVLALRGWFERPESDRETARDETPVHDTTAQQATGERGGTGGSRAWSDLPVMNVSDSAIVALGMVDGTDTRYQQDPELLMSDLRTDVRRQILEKAVGIYVERGALLEHYDELASALFGHGELVERLVDDARPRHTPGGLVYLPAAAEVRLQDLRKLVFRLSREERLALIRAQGDPLISVAVSIRDAERGSPIERSALAENVIKQRIREFGFRVASPRGDGGPAPDFAIESEAKLKTLRHTLPASGLTIQKYALTSWTVKCTDLASDEDIYFDNRIPEVGSGSWPDEDRALQEIGTLVADAFSRDFFAEHLPRTSRTTRLAIRGLPAEAAPLLQRELVGLRSVVRVDAAADTGDTTAFDVRWYDQGPGGEQSFDGTVLAPVRRKLGRDCLVADTDGGAEVAVRLSADCAHGLPAKLTALPPAALGDAPAQRLAALARSLDTMRLFAQINRDAVSALAASGSPLARDALVAPAPPAKVEL